MWLIGNRMVITAADAKSGEMRSQAVYLRAIIKASSPAVNGQLVFMNKPRVQDIWRFG